MRALDLSESPVTSASKSNAVQPIIWLGDRLRLLDQRLLPLEELSLIHI